MAVRGALERSLQPHLRSFVAAGTCLGHTTSVQEGPGCAGAPSASTFAETGPCGFTSSHWKSWSCSISQCRAALELAKATSKTQETAISLKVASNSYKIKQTIQFNLSLFKVDIMAEHALLSRNYCRHRDSVGEKDGPGVLLCRLPSDQDTRSG